MAVAVQEVLARVEQEQELRLKSISVDKEQELQFDLGNLLALDPNPASGRRLQQEGEAMLRALARDNTQLLIGQLWALPTRRVSEVIVAELPPVTTRLPREKPTPKAKPRTRWEEFARLKGLRKKKRTNLAWDERRQEWRRRWGYGRVNDQAAEWALEVPVNADPNEDQFAKRAGLKKERVAKNELQRLRNIARGRKLLEPGAAAGPPSGLPQHPGKRELSRAILTAKRSTASVGRFQDKLPREKDNPRGSGRKRQFQPLLGDFSAEKRKQLELLQHMASLRPKLNMTKAVNKQLREDERQEAAEKRKKKGKGGRGRGRFRDGKKGGKPAAGGRPKAGHKPAAAQRGKGKQTQS